MDCAAFSGIYLTNHKIKDSLNRSYWYFGWSLLGMVVEMFARFAPNDYANFRNSLSSILERECGGMSEEELRNELMESFADE